MFNREKHRHRGAPEKVINTYYHCVCSNMVCICVCGRAHTAWGIKFRFFSNNNTQWFYAQRPLHQFSHLVAVPLWEYYLSDPKSHILKFYMIYVKTLCTLDKIMVGWGFVPMVIALYGSVPDTSFCLPHCAVGAECGGPRGVKSGLKELYCGL